MFHIVLRGEIHYTEALEILKNIDPPLGFGKKCPDKMAYKRLIRMNMPINKKGRVSFTTTLFALIRDNLKINVRESAEMDQADLELRATIMKMWPITRSGKIDLLGKLGEYIRERINFSCFSTYGGYHWARKVNCGKALRWSSHL